MMKDTVMAEEICNSAKWYITFQILFSLYLCYFVSGYRNFAKPLLNDEMFVRKRNFFYLYREDIKNERGAKKKKKGKQKEVGRP